MIFTETDLKGAFIIDLEKFEDQRGFFSRAWDTKKFHEFGLNPRIVQCNISFTKKKGTIRGLHYQVYPYEETKLVRCTQGKIFDVIIDLRPNSKTLKKWRSFELSVENHQILYVPEGFAHGFQSLVDNTEIFYQVSQFYHSDSERGIRWNDPFFNIKWPLEITEISQKDNSWNLYHDTQ